MGLINFLIESGALPSSLGCASGCGNANLIKVGKHFYWRCQKNVKKASNRKREKCTFKQSVHKYTFFERSNLTIVQICKFVNLWIKNVPLCAIMEECEIRGKATMTDWASFCREVCFDKMVLNAEPIGGPGKVVEIDESKFGKRKYHRGHRVEGQWANEIALPIIKHWILLGTTIMSDCWKSYDCLADEGFTHLRVNHSIEFVYSVTGGCTNRIKASWNAAHQDEENIFIMGI